MFLGILTYIAAIITINLMGYQIETRHLVYLSAVTMLFDSLHLSIYGTLRAYGNLRYEAIGTFVRNFDNDFGHVFSLRRSAFDIFQRRVYDSELLQCLLLIGNFV